MKNNLDKSSSKSYTTLFSSIFFILLNLILLTIFAWFLLIVWFMFNGQLSFVELLIVTTKLIFIRLKLFLIKTPFILLILIACSIDGLVCRDIRKFQCARESAFLFHRLKPFVILTFYFIFFCYMFLPIQCHAECFFLMACCSGIFIKLSIEHFKKYV